MHRQLQRHHPGGNALGVRFPGCRPAVCGLDVWRADRGCEERAVFKTLVARGDKNGIHVFCIPVREELDLKKAAAVTDNKKVELVHVKELLNLTGYIRGGCSPIGMKKEYPVTIEETAVLFDTISISAGVRGGQIVIDPEKLSEFLGASFLDVVR